jgi:hypothetical protein
VGANLGESYNLAALAHHPQHPMLLLEVGDVGVTRFEDPQPEQAEHHHQGEVVEVGRLARRGEQRLELQMRQPQRRRHRRHHRPAHMLGR